MDIIERILDDLDDDFLEDFGQRTGSTLDEIESFLMDIHLASNSLEREERIIELIQDLKMSCRLAFLDPLVAYIQSFESLILKSHHNPDYKTPMLEEIALLAFDEIRASCQSVTSFRSLDLQLLEDLTGQLRNLVSISISEYNETLKEMIAHFANRVNPDLVFSALEVTNFDTPKIQSTAHEDQSVLATTEPLASDILPNEDLSFFEDLAYSVENRSKFWEGRSKTLLDTCHLINDCLAEKVDPSQLAAAVYMHDFCMSMLPDSLLFKEGKYESHEVMLLQLHPLQAYELLKRMPGWEEAARMVREHHERIDGTGYPSALKRNEICLGAKILAVADAFFSLTNQRSDREYKKSVLRAVSEINKHNGTQFDPVVVEAFNRSLS